MAKLPRIGGKKTSKIVYLGTRSSTNPMPKITERWLLFQYVGGEFTPLSKPFKTKQQGEKARRKYRTARRLGLV